MTVLVDTSVLIDCHRGDAGAAAVLEGGRGATPLHASEITRLEVFSGRPPAEVSATRPLLSTLVWHPVDTEVAEVAGALGHRSLPRQRGVDAADLAIAATAIRVGADLLTRNVRHFPMFPGLHAPY